MNFIQNRKYTSAISVQDYIFAPSRTRLVFFITPDSLAAWSPQEVCCGLKSIHISYSIHVLGPLQWKTQMLGLCWSSAKMPKRSIVLVIIQSTYQTFIYPGMNFLNGIHTSIFLQPYDTNSEFILRTLVSSINFEFPAPNWISIPHFHHGSACLWLADRGLKKQ